MAQDRTAGFDILIQVSESEINAQLAAAFASGTMFPPELSSPIDAFGITGTAMLSFRTPVMDLDRPRPRVGITVPFRDSQLEILTPVPATIAPLGGTIVIEDAVQMRTTGANQQAVIDFTAGAPTVTVTFDAATVALLTPLLSGFGITIAMVQNQMATIVRDRLVDDVQRIPMTPPIAVANDNDPLTPFNFEVTTVNDLSAADRDALTFGVRTGADSGGNINGITQSFIPAGGQSVVMMSNFWLLARVIRPQVAAALNRPVSDFDTPLRLNRSIPIPGQDATLRRLEARVVGNRIRVDGRATASGTGWSAVAVFHFFVSLTLSGGNIVVTATEPVIDIDVDLAWWVWLLGLGLGGLFGGVAGAIVAAIVLAIVEAIAEGIVENMATDAFNNVAADIPPIPLGPVGAGLTLSNLVLDDLELRGPIVRSLKMPVKSSGTHTSLAGFTIDLDTGHVRAPGDVRFETDLIWNPASGFTTTASTRLTVTSLSYGALTPVQLEKLAYATTTIAASSVPLALDLPMFGTHPEIVFGVLTNQGRVAKVRAWRSLMQGGALVMRWVTYDRPIPELDIALRWDVIERGESFSYIGPNFAPCSRAEVARRCSIEAWPKLMTFPVTYQWCLCGTVLTDGEGSVATPSGPVQYKVKGRFLELTTSMAQALDCELCVSAIDARNRELFTCVPLKISGTETTCGKPKRFLPKPRLELIPCDPLRAIDTHVSVFDPRVKAQLKRALDAGVESAVINEHTATPPTQGHGSAIPG